MGRSIHSTFATTGNAAGFAAGTAKSIPARSRGPLFALDLTVE
jgi:hypothetical protein